MDDHAGAAIFGGPQSANDNEEFVHREIDWIGVPLRDKKPYLGICLGAQMMARHLGARVYPASEGHAEVGYYPIRPTEAGRKVCAEWPDHVYQWHREGFELPSGGELLAEGDAFSIQAFRLWHRLCAAVSSRGYARHDVSMACSRRAPNGVAWRQATPRAHRRSRRARFGFAQLAGRIHRPLDRSCAGQSDDSSRVLIGAFPRASAIDKSPSSLIVAAGSGD